MIIGLVQNMESFIYDFKGAVPSSSYSGSWYHSWIVIDSQQVVLGLLPMRPGIGLAAGFVLEAGLYMFYSETVIRFFVSVIMSVILAHYNEAAYKTDDYQEWGNIDSDFGQNTIDFGKDLGKRQMMILEAERLFYEVDKLKGTKECYYNVFFMRTDDYVDFGKIPLTYC